jgi:hypothetical protein
MENLFDLNRNFKPRPSLSDSRVDVSKCATNLLSIQDAWTKFDKSAKRKHGPPKHNDSMRVFVDVTPLAPSKIRKIPKELGKFFAKEKANQVIEYLKTKGPSNSANIIESYPLDPNIEFDVKEDSNMPNPPTSLSELIAEPWRIGSPEKGSPLMRRFDDPRKSIAENFMMYAAQQFMPFPPQLANSPLSMQITDANFIEGDFKLATNNVYIVTNVNPMSIFAHFRVTDKSNFVRAFIVLETNPSCWLRVCKSMNGGPTAHVTDITKMYCPSIISNPGSSNISCASLIKCRCEDNLDNTADKDPACGKNQKELPTPETTDGGSNGSSNGGSDGSSNGDSNGDSKTDPDDKSKTDPDDDSKIDSQTEKIDTDDENEAPVVNTQTIIIIALIVFIILLLLIVVYFWKSDSSKAIMIKKTNNKIQIE